MAMDLIITNTLNKLKNQPKTAVYEITADGTAQSMDFSSRSETLKSAWIEGRGFTDTGSNVLKITVLQNNSTIHSLQTISSGAGASNIPLDMTSYLHWGSSGPTYITSYSQDFETSWDSWVEVKSGTYSETQRDTARPKTGTYSMYSKVGYSGNAGRYRNWSALWVLDTFEVWVNTDNFDAKNDGFAYMELLTAYGGQSACAIGLNKDKFRYQMQGGSWVDIPSSPAPADDTWYKFKIVYNPTGNTDFYVYDSSLSLLCSTTQSSGGQILGCVYLNHTGGSPNPIDEYMYWDDFSATYSGSAPTTNSLKISYTVTGTAYYTQKALLYVTYE